MPGIRIAATSSLFGAPFGLLAYLSRISKGLPFRGHCGLVWPVFAASKHSFRREICVIAGDYLLLSKTPLLYNRVPRPVNSSRSSTPRNRWYGGSGFRKTEMKAMHPLHCILPAVAVTPNHPKFLRNTSIGRIVAVPRTYRNPKRKRFSELVLCVRLRKHRSRH